MVLSNEQIHAKQNPEINTTAQTNLVHNKVGIFKHWGLFISNAEINERAKRRKGRVGSYSSINSKWMRDLNEKIKPLNKYIYIILYIYIKIWGWGEKTCLNYDSKSKNNKENKNKSDCFKKIFAWQKTNATQGKCICNVYHKGLTPLCTEKR